MLAAVCISLGDVNSTSPAVSCTDLINSRVFCEYEDQSRLRNFADGAFFSGNQYARDDTKSHW